MSMTNGAVATRTILAARELTKLYPVRGSGQPLAAVAGVSLSLSRGETLGIVGESGCGKSTVARLLVRLEQPTSGQLELDGPGGHDQVVVHFVAGIPYVVDEHLGRPQLVARGGEHGGTAEPVRLEAGLLFARRSAAARP